MRLLSSSSAVRLRRGRDALVAFLPCLRPTAASIFFLAVALTTHAAPLPLAGSAPIPIVTTDAPTPPESFAATELAKYLHRITGASFPVTRSALTTPPPARAILIGRGFAEASGESFSAAKLGADGFILKRRGDDIFVAGEVDRATLYAAYALLEHLGCGFYAPNFDYYGAATGETIPHTPDTSVPDTLDVVERPTSPQRELYLEEGESHTLKTIQQIVDWMPKARMNVLCCAIDYQGEGKTKWDNWREGTIPETKKRGIELEIGGHGFQVFLPAAKYFKAHPEWFGMDHGKRTDDMKVVFSTANREAVQTYTENLRAYLRAHPEIDIFDWRPPDSSHWSDSPEDNALGAPTERQLRLLHEVLASLHDEFPHLRFRFESYNALLEPPQDPSVRPPPHSLMEFCPINRSFRGPLSDPSLAENHQYYPQLVAWARLIDPQTITIMSYVTKYQWRSLPILIPHLISADARDFARLRLGGQSSYCEPGAWATYELDHWIFARCLWNAAVDPDAELSAYAQGRYGPAAAPALQYLKLVESIVPNAVAIPGTHLEMKTEQRYLLRFRLGARLLEQAQTLAAGDKPVQAGLAKLQGSQRYTENELALRAAFLEAGTTWRRDQMTKLKALLSERDRLIDEGSRQGLIVVDARTR